MGTSADPREIASRVFFTRPHPLSHDWLSLPELSRPLLDWLSTLRPLRRGRWPGLSPRSQPRSASRCLPPAACLPLPASPLPPPRVLLPVWTPSLAVTPATSSRPDLPFAVFHRSADHPAGGAHPPDPLLRLHGQGELPGGGAPGISPPCAEVGVEAGPRGGWGGPARKGNQTRTRTGPGEGFGAEGWPRAGEFGLLYHPVWAQEVGSFDYRRMSWAASVPGREGAFRQTCVVDHLRGGSHLTRWSDW